MSTSTITPLTFTGVSTYASDFQSILTRTVNIASLPLQQLQNSESDVLSKKTQLSTFGDSVTALSTAFTTLTQAATSKGLQATSSDSTIVSATVSGADSAAVHTINSITSLATPASETSTSGYADSSTTKVSSTGSLSLTVGSKTYAINLTAAQNNLAGLRDAINSLNAGVSATILTTGTGANPNYLQVAATANGKTTLSLTDDPTGAKTSLLTSANQGTDAVFQLDGITVDQQSNNVNAVVPGLTFSLLAKSANPVTLTLSSTQSDLSSALSGLASAYNGVVDEIGGQVGQAGGLLTGSYLVNATSNLLRQITGYQGSSTASGAVNSLADLGITLDNTGHMAFDSTKLSGFTDAQLTSAFAFVGSDTTGLGAQGAKLQQLTDPITGFIKTQQDSYDQTDTNLKSQISTLTDRINALQTSTQARLQTMDTLIATLQSQQTVISASVQAIDLSLFGKQPTT